MCLTKAKYFPSHYQYQPSATAAQRGNDGQVHAANAAYCIQPVASSVEASVPNYSALHTGMRYMFQGRRAGTIHFQI